MRRLIPCSQDRCGLTCWAVLVLILLTSGCQRFETWRGEGYTDKDAEWGKKYRPTGPKGERYFFDDERAAQIERSLGL